MYVCRGLAKMPILLAATTTLAGSRPLTSTTSALITPLGELVLRM